jgi:hypothetical protein
MPAPKPKKKKIITKMPRSAHATGLCFVFILGIIISSGSA